MPQVNGQPKTVTDYKDWRADLINRLGPYCCYCNMRLNDNPQVEHVAPKTPVPQRALDWDNMLLACGACNSRKNDELCEASTHFLPDAHDTQLAFTHRLVPHPRLPLELAVIVAVHPGLTPAQRLKAQATITMCGLDNIPTDKQGIARASDRRWKHRYEELLEASIWRQKWNAATLANQVVLLEAMLAIVKRGGFFSVWFDAFHDVPAVKQLLTRAFPNTAPCVPAPTLNPVPRIAGDL